MPRKRIADPLQSSLLNANAGACCVCKTRRVGTNFHHIDRNPSNNDPANLAVLCVKDHDAHHRPLRYPALNHLDLRPGEITRYKKEWEQFVSEARKPHPNVLTVLNIYGFEEYVHSMRLIFQWASGGIVFERMYHLTDGPFDQWADLAIEEILWLGEGIKLVVIDAPLEVEHCPSCRKGFANTIDSNVAARLTSPDWESESIGSVYVNPFRASLAIQIVYRDEPIATASMHRCGRCLHFACNNYEERVPVRHYPSVRTQARAIVQKYLRDWTPGELLIGTGNPDVPEVISFLDLPAIWEHVAAQPADAGDEGPGIFSE